jgi:hypothetical protein
MAGTVVGVFRNHWAAEQAAQALLDHGVPLADIAIVAKDAGGETGAPDVEGSTPVDRGEEFLTTAVREVPEHDVEQPINTADEAIARAVVGFVIGAPLGSLAVALLIYFPHFGPIFAAHPLIPQFLGAGIVGIGCAIYGAITAGGIPNEVARTYHNEVQRGHALVTALSSSRNAPDMQQVLKEHGGHRLGFYARFIDSIQSVESDNVHQPPAEAAQ